MKNSVVINHEKGTISGTFHIQRGGCNAGNLTATIEMRDMTPSDLERINEMTESLAKDIISGVARCAINQSAFFHNELSQ